MSKKFVFATALAVCVALAFAPAIAGRTDRAGKGSADRGNTAVPTGGASDVIRHASDNGVRERPADASKAESYLAQAMGQTGNDALATLMQITRMELGDDVQRDKILAEVYRLMGDAHEGSSSKQVALYGLAMQYTADASTRTLLESKIAGLGGNVVATSVQQQAVRSPDYNTCDTAFMAGPVPPTFSLPMTIDYGEHDFVAFDVMAAAGTGNSFRIETLTPLPYFSDDTDMWLWGGCDAGVPTNLIDFDGDGGEYWMSLINTDCLAAGTYYVEVAGWLDFSAVPDFTLEIEQTGSCIFPVVDDYEPDDARDNLATIGLPTSIPTHANGWGRAKSEIQARTIFPANDIDNMVTRLSRTEWVSYSTQTTFPTKFNGFTDSALDLGNPDTLVAIYYEEEPWYGGFCNDPDAGFDPFCITADDCTDPVGEPIPGFPACIPLYYFQFTSGTPLVYLENPLAVDDDGGAGLSSSAQFCTPKPGRTWKDALSMNGDFMVQVLPYSTTQTFNYEVQVKNHFECLFETENNGYFENATALPLAETAMFINGIYDHAGARSGTGGEAWFQTFVDTDLFYFDVDSEKEVLLQTNGYDSYAVDTYLELYVGPDDFGDYYFTGVADDDSGPGWLSALDVILPPASELLGNVTADANYFVNVSSAWYNLNFPYELWSMILLPPEYGEAEPNDTVGTANDVAIGDAFIASINPTCDMDVYKMTLTGDTHVNMATDGGDTAVELVDCATSTRLGCDDDGGPGLASMIDACLPAGEYCFKVRAYSGFSSFDYNIAFTGGESCPPTSVTADGLYRCDEVPPGEFDVCPN